MASRCGCSGQCACVLSTDASLALTGNGSAESPWMLRVVPNCQTTVDCVSQMVSAPLTVQAGQLGLRISTDADQVLTTGSDGGLYVPGCEAGAVAISDTSTIDLSGAGLTGQPLAATWLGATTQSNNSGVTLIGNGTPGNPLIPDWGGVNVSVTNPEMNVTGRGTPASPLTFSWAGLPWTKVQQNPLPTITSGTTNYYFTWSTMAGHGTTAMSPNASNAQWLLCQRSGAYLQLTRLRLLLNASQTMQAGGYVQLWFEVAGGTPILWDFVVPTYGAGWVDLSYVEEVQLTSGNNYAMRILNSSGSSGTSGWVRTTFFRVSELT